MFASGGDAHAMTFQGQGIPLTIRGGGCGLSLEGIGNHQEIACVPEGGYTLPGDY